MSYNEPFTYIPDSIPSVFDNSMSYYEFVTKLYHLLTETNGRIDDLVKYGINEDVAALFKKFFENEAIIAIGLNAGANAPDEVIDTDTLKFYKNIAIGGGAMQFNEGGRSSIAIGWDALKNAVEGSYSNIAIGNDVMLYTNKTNSDNFSATRNIGIGTNSLRFNQNGYQSVAIGRNALQNVENGYQNTVVGVNAMGGTAPIDLSGEIVNLTPSDSIHVTAIGYNALHNGVSDFNTALGANAAFSLTTSSKNTAIGAGSLNKLQENVTHLGTEKYFSNTNCTYVWILCDIIVTLPGHGLEVGWLVNLGLKSGDVESTENIMHYIHSVTNDTFTVKVDPSLSRQTSGNAFLSWYSNNVAVTTPIGENTVVGAYAMEKSLSGKGNTVVGAYSLQQNNGDNNTFVGNVSGGNLTVGDWNVGLGYGAMRFMLDGNPATNVSYATCLGANSAPSGGNQVQLGQSTQTTYAYGSIQDRSDERDKTDIRDTVLGLEFINKLRPVDFKWDYREDYIEISDDGEIIKHKHDGSKKRNRYHHGLIAQEVQKVIKDSGIDFGGYQDHSINGGADILSIGYSELIAPLIKAVQELSNKVKALEEK